MYWLRERGQICAFAVNSNLVPPMVKDRLCSFAYWAVVSLKKAHRTIYRCPSEVLVSAESVACNEHERRAFVDDSGCLPEDGRSRCRNLSLFAQRTPSVTVQRKQPINPAKAAANKSSEKAANKSSEKAANVF